MTIILIMLFGNPIFSNGTSNGTVYLKSNKENVAKGETVEVILGIEGAKTASYLANVYFDDSKFEYVSGPDNLVVEGSKIKILWYDELGGNGATEGELGTIIFKAKQDGTANFVIDGNFYNQDAKEIETEFKNLQIEVGSEQSNEIQDITETSDLELENTNLETLAIENILLNPPFDNQITEYNIEVSNEISSLNIFAVGENENSVVEISGNDNLKEGNNKIKITVIDPNGINKKVYSVNAYKRNTNEEVQYKEEEKVEKEKAQEKLKHAYEIDEQSKSNEIEETKEDEKEKAEVDAEISEAQDEEKVKNKSTRVFVIIIIIILIICAIAIYLLVVVNGQQ